MHEAWVVRALDRQGDLLREQKAILDQAKVFLDKGDLATYEKLLALSDEIERERLPYDQLLDRLLGAA